MDPQQPATSYSVTCEAHDEAVVHCLNALAYYSEHVAGAADGQGAAGRLPALVTPKEWERANGHVTFHFSDPRRRGVFLGEATRLLSGKWIRLELGN